MNSIPSGNSISSEISAVITKIDRDVDLTNCDREPIHTPNLIQPHGVLLAVSADEYRILQVSLNTTQMLGIEPEELLDKPLPELLGEKQFAAIKSCLAENFDNINPLPIEMPSSGRGTSSMRSSVSARSSSAIEKDDEILFFNGIVHRNGEIVIVELEPCQFESKGDFFDFYKLVKSPIDKLRNTDSLDRFCNAIVSEVKRITEFDRVMVYRFAPDGSGTVIAEAANQELKPYLGLHYPATDIPKRAKHLFTLKSLRSIPDVAYEPVGITPELNPLTNELLDMSMTTLRSVSPFTSSI